MWASHGMIPDFRTRQPRDGPMQCGSQPADISVIHRRLKLLGVALSIRCGKPHRTGESTMRKTARTTRAPLDKHGPYQSLGKSIERLQAGRDQVCAVSSAARPSRSVAPQVRGRASHARIFDKPRSALLRTRPPAIRAAIGHPCPSHRRQRRPPRPSALQSVLTERMRGGHFPFPRSRGRAALGRPECGRREAC